MYLTCHDLAVEGGGIDCGGWVDDEGWRFLARCVAAVFNIAVRGGHAGGVGRSDCRRCE